MFASSLSPSWRSRRSAPAPPTALATLVLVAVLAAALAPGVAGAQEDAAWQIVPQPQATLVLAADGAMLGAFGPQQRVSVSLASLPRYLPQAFIAVEDQRFYQHDGVDVVGVAGAIKDAILGDVRGASTITQQLVGNMHPEQVDRSDRSIARKLREQAAARAMEKRYSKAQILEAYLNQIAFGRGWYGVEMAARGYFGKPAAELSLAEAATLAALPKGPAVYDPIGHAARAKQRRNLVLELMAQQGYISRAAARAAERAPLVTVPNGGRAADAGYAVALARREATRAGVPVGDGGYRIVTTVLPALQRDAVSALRAGLDRAEERLGRARSAADSTGLQGLAVVLEATTGNVLAYSGGRDYSASQFDRAAFGMRQPGSAMKPFVYAAALAQGLPPNAVLADTAIAIPLDNGDIYRPQDDDGVFRGSMTLRDALVGSRNSVAVQLWQMLGADSVITLARRAGVSTPIAPYPSSAIGASVVRPLDFIAAYTVFDNGGAAAEPRLVQRVEDRRGQVVYEAPRPSPASALDPRVAFITRSLLQGVVNRGTATAVRRYLPERVPAAGKTGTTNDNTDAWFIGMTPELVGGVWVGYDRPRAMPGGAGGSLAAPIWGDLMARWYRGRETGAWTPPPGVVAVELDRATGTPATPYTPPERRYTEYFLEGTQPGAPPFDPWAIFAAGPIVQ